MHSKNNGWIKAYLTVGGMIWIGRAVLQLAFSPDYWNPHSAIDYVAIVGTSMGLFTLALGLWGVAMSQATFVQAKPVWKFSITLVCISAVLAGTVNLIEDAFGLKSIGFLFPLAILALAVGLLMAGVAALRDRQMHRSIGWLILLCLVGLLTVEVGGGIIVGLSLVALTAAPVNTK